MTFDLKRFDFGENELIFRYISMKYHECPSNHMMALSILIKKINLSVTRHKERDATARNTGGSIYFFCDSSIS